jgi:hypothetical protein
MSVLNLKTTALALVAGVSLAGCAAYGPYGGIGAGVGYNNGYYDPYYGGGYYGAGYGAPYGYGYGSPYGYGYGMPYYGWNDGYYYPGTGYYVYDRNRTPHSLTDAQRRFWQQRRAAATAKGGTARIVENWADFQNGPQTTNTVVRQRNVTMNTATNRTFAEPVERSQTRQQQRTTRSSEVLQQDRRTNRGHNRHVDSE